MRRQQCWMASGGGGASRCQGSGVAIERTSAVTTGSSTPTTCGGASAGRPGGNGLTLCCSSSQCLLQSAGASMPGDPESAASAASAAETAGASLDWNCIGHAWPETANCPVTSATRARAEAMRLRNRDEARMVRVGRSAWVRALQPGNSLSVAAAGNRLQQSHVSFYAQCGSRTRQARCGALISTGLAPILRLAQAVRWAAPGSTLRRRG